VNLLITWLHSSGLKKIQKEAFEIVFNTLDYFRMFWNFLEVYRFFQGFLGFFMNIFDFLRFLTD
jgi:hypothetical protein